MIRAAAGRRGWSCARDQRAALSELAVRGGKGAQVQAAEFLAQVAPGVADGGFTAAFDAAAASALERFFFLDDGDRALVG